METENVKLTESQVKQMIGRSSRRMQLSQGEVHLSKEVNPNISLGDLYLKANEKLVANDGFAFVRAVHELWDNFEEPRRRAIKTFVE